MTVTAERLKPTIVFADGAPCAAEAVARPGAIILARHGEPSLSRKIKLDSEGYRRWWAAYEEGGLLQGQQPPKMLVQAAREAGFVFASSRRRSQETARAVCAGRDFEAEVGFIEAPLPPPKFPSFLRFSPRTWGVISRFWWWFFDHHAGQETRRQAEGRALEQARKLIERAEGGQDVLVVAHGFFNGMIGVELQKLGWRCVLDQGYRYWSARRFERRD